MSNRQTVALLAAMALPALIAAQAGGPEIAACGDLLPEGSHYSLQIDLDWDRRGEVATGGMSVSLTDERTGHRGGSVPEEAREFARCVRTALGIPQDADD